MRLLFTIVAAISLLAISGCSRSKEGGNYTHVASEDSAMNAAIAKAKATSGDFIRAFHEQKPGTKDFYVKKPYPVPSGEVEHMWIKVLQESNGVLDGIVANEAEETHEVKIGQGVSLNISEITDWKYVDERRLVGGYTIRYFYERMSPEEQEDFIKETGFEL
jgi:uncharacterized protein YegJ (DUF2314 family)